MEQLQKHTSEEYESIIDDLCYDWIFTSGPEDYNYVELYINRVHDELISGRHNEMFDKYLNNEITKQMLNDYADRIMMDTLYKDNGDKRYEF